MRIAIMGSGAIGGYLGARLAVAGHDVTFIARGPTSRQCEATDCSLKVRSAISACHM